LVWKNLQEKLLFNCIFHHGGEFVRDDVLFYRGGKQTIVSDIDLQTWGMAAIDEIVTGWGYDKQHYRIWGAVDGKDGRFFQIYVDHLAEEVVIKAIGDEVDGHIYLEHNQHQVLVRDLEFREPIYFDMKNNTEMEDSGYSSDDGFDDLGLDDSENERAIALDDGFDDIENEEVPAEKLLIGNMKKKKEPEKKKNLSKGKGKGPIVEPEKEEEQNLSEGEGKAPMVEAVDDYFSEELDSSDPDDSDHEPWPRYEKFRKEQLNKDYEFRLGMEFNSLKEFKDAIREWNVLNGHEISFEKNESYRVRIVCKEDAVKKGDKRQEGKKRSVGIYVFVL
jgi:hypothetical protein